MLVEITSQVLPSYLHGESVPRHADTEVVYYITRAPFVLKLRLERKKDVARHVDTEEGLTM